MKKNKFRLILAVIFLICFFGIVNHSQAQSETSDAIAVRVVPNPNHYSVFRWYDSQGFQGSPQALIVDGYEAIRDGRTVYVNAANIDLATRTIYTNIYLISYNQNPAAKTVDILGQIVSHWKFNSNLTSPTASSTCAISAISCGSNTDCATDQFCATSSAENASSSCLLKEAKNCLVDTDCPNNLFCDSLKAKIARDIRRVGKLEELKEALFKFKNLNDRYPVLAAGTYLKNYSLSVWPSWTQALLADLAVSQNFFDPINRLGACPGFDFKTCWNKDTQRFFSDPPSPGGSLVLPTGSYGLVYATDDNGSNYDLCAVMESRDPVLSYRFSPNDPASSACVTATGIMAGGESTNSAPQLINKFLTGEAGREFNGFIKVSDKEKNPLTWSISVSGWSGSPLILKDTSNPEQKKVYAQTAAGKGIYPLNLTVTDNRGGVLSTTTPITIIAPVTAIEADNGEYILDPKIPFGYSFSFFSNNLTGTNPNYTLTKVSGQLDLLNSGSIKKTVEVVGSNKYRVNFKGYINTGSKFYQDADLVYRLSVTDKLGQTASKEFLIKIIVQNPALDFNCPLATRLNRDYKCFIGTDRQGNHTINYTGSLPQGLNLATDNTLTLNSLPSKLNWFSRIGGMISPVLGADVDPLNYYIKGQPTALGLWPTVVRATNEYGASTTKQFFLKVNNYCGDGIKQAPNTEGRGGIYNDGYEDCDGSSGITASPSSSSPEWQYGCQTGPNTTTPEPISTNSYCIFTSPLKGGGYCGDTYCQAKIGDRLMETITNCPIDCNTVPPDCTPKCASNNACGPDGCGGSCGECKGICLKDGTCSNSYCQPTCIDKACGDNGCGGSCGSCPSNMTCASGRCLKPGCKRNGTCEPKLGENCASCAIDCGCGAYQTCNQNLQSCVTQGTCPTSCGSRQCGDNGCGGVCGICPPKDVCLKTGYCCTPIDCTNRECGSDGCIKECGPDCPTGKICNSKGRCVEPPKDYCGDKKCTATANEDCKTCPADCACEPNQVCKANSSGKFVCSCNDSCEGRECGTNDCGGSCGTCPAGETCRSNQCFGGGDCSHYVNCVFKECGPDGCGTGETCGTCLDNQNCNHGVCVDIPPDTPDNLSGI